ncbi:MAG: YggS family pyridoxal phosphate-dependent enzyme [Gemmataceae bacterium]|nr:YggS family pyridoxal phosphate-dependent enzyme [Gemmataceae bacterium]
MERLRRNLAKVEERLQAACRRAGRDRKEITLVAVTKSVSAEIAALLPALGIVDLGESRPQELWRKAEALPKDLRWHLIGHLQRNKVARTLPAVHWIDSVDSARLLRTLDSESAKLSKTLDVLLEVNASGEAQKHGFRLGEIAPLAPLLRDLTSVRVRGLMTMAALQEPERCRPAFKLLRELRDRLRQELVPPHAVEHLSMGMSNDFEVAVEEGATFVRLGSVLFEGIV